MKKRNNVRAELERLASERRNPRTMSLSSLRTEKILRVINNEDRKVAPAVAREIPKISNAVDAIAKRLARGGKLYYVGAGTSGRLAVIDAAELLPTFGAGPELVQAIIAGGRPAVFRSIEGSEDRGTEAKKELRNRGLRSRDAVLAISASGRTPFAVAALYYAKSCHALRVALTVNRNSPLCKLAEIAICPDTGQEAITGSTRMKAGTAQKLILNMISSSVMVKLGRVHGNLMVSLRPMSRKLVERAIRIISLETGLDYDDSKKLLRKGSMNPAVAIVMAKCSAHYKEALNALSMANGSIEGALKLCSK